MPTLAGPDAALEDAKQDIMDTDDAPAMGTYHQLRALYLSTKGELECDCREIHEHHTDADACLGLYSPPSHL